MDERDEFGVEVAGPVREGEWKDEPPRTLVELINRVLDRGVVVGGDVTISLAGVDLVYLGLNALLTSVSTARQTLGREVGTRRPLVPPGESPAPSLPAADAERETPGARRAAERTSKPERPELESSTTREEASEDVVQAALAEVARTLPDRIDVDPDAVQRDLARLVLTLVELLRRVVEHQAVRRMDDPDLDDAQIERMGLALKRLEEKLGEIRAVFGLAEGDLDVDLGPLGKLY